MKNIWKQSLSVVLGGVLLVAGCTPNEELNLPGFPTAESGITIAETEGLTQLSLNAAYDNTGALQIDGPLTRTYEILLSTARVDDVVFTCAAHAVNIPADKIVISSQSVRIPAGHTSANVTVGLVDENTDFISEFIPACDYELGLKIVEVLGKDVSLSNSDAMVKLSKPAYVSSASISDAENREVQLTRAYWAGGILNDKAMEYTFKAKLSRPAKKDVKVEFTSTGLAEAFAKDMVITPSSVVIPAGKLESDPITWTLSDDFLLTTTEMEEHNIVLKANFVTEDTNVQADSDGGDQITFNIKKVFEAVRATTAVSADWSMFSRTGWVVDGNGKGDGVATVFDAKMNTSCDGKAPMWFTIDMLENKDITGFATRYYNNSTSASIKTVAFYISDDNINWNSIGSITNESRKGAHFYELLGAISSRYLKIEVMAGWASSSTIYLAEIEVYGAKN